MIKMTSKNQVIEFNIGGSIFATTHRTLRKHPGNLLLKLYTEDLNAFGTENGYSESPSNVCKDKNGIIFIDRDPKLFRFILNFMRNGELQLSKNFVDFHLLEQEAVFYKIPELKTTISALETRDCLASTSGIELHEEKFVLVEVFSGRNPRTRVVGLDDQHPLTTHIRSVLHNHSLNRTEKSYQLMRLGGTMMGMTLWRPKEGNDCAIVEKWKIPLVGTFTIRKAPEKKALSPRRGSSFS